MASHHEESKQPGTMMLKDPTMETWPQYPIVIHITWRKPCFQLKGLSNMNLLRLFERTCHLIIKILNLRLSF